MSRVLPILFNTEMVQAILEGRKTVTRRLVKPSQFMGLAPDKCPNKLPEEFIKEKPLLFIPWCQMEDAELIGAIYKPPYTVGDYLYVRETWQLEEFYDGEALIRFKAGGELGIDYECEGDVYVKLLKYSDKTGWQPSLFMPKEAARIFLKVKDVHAERLQDITEKHAEKEGFIDTAEYFVGNTARGHFRNLWDTTIKKTDIDKYGWSANPWVWVIEFERCAK